MRGRPSRRRDLVHSELERLREPVRAQDLHAALRARGHPIGLLTVYRVLQQLQADGQVSVLYAAGIAARYRLRGSDTGVPLMCRTCRRSVEVDGAAAYGWVDAVAARHGFTDVGLVAELHGRCPDCVAADGA